MQQPETTKTSSATPEETNKSNLKESESDENAGAVQSVSTWLYVILLTFILILSGLLLLGRKQLASEILSSNSSSNTLRRDPVQYSSAIELDSGFVQVSFFLNNFKRKYH